MSTNSIRAAVPFQKALCHLESIPVLLLGVQLNDQLLIYLVVDVVTGWHCSNFSFKGACFFFDPLWSWVFAQLFNEGLELCAVAGFLAYCNHITWFYLVRWYVNALAIYGEVSVTYQLASFTTA